MELHMIPFLLAILLIFRKIYFDIALYNERRETNVGLLGFMMSFHSLGIMFPVLGAAQTEREQHLIRMANQSIYFAYLLLIATVLIASFTS